MQAVRLAEPDEISLCAALYERIGRTHFTWKPPDAFRAGDFLEMARAEDLWVAHQQDRLAGFLSYYVPDHFVHTLFVDDAMRRCGTGRLLLQHVRGHYAVPHTLKVNHANAPARAFYCQLGYRALDEGKTDGISWIRLTSP